MRRTKEKLFLLLILILQLSCTKEQSIEMYDLNPLLNAKVQQANQSNDSVKLDLCNQIPFKWEKIIVIPPYSNDKDVKKYNLANAKFIEKQLPVLALDWGLFQKWPHLFLQSGHIFRSKVCTLFRLKVCSRLILRRFRTLMIPSGLIVHQPY